MNYVIEKEFNEILISVKNDVNYCSENSSYYLILGMIKKEDSLLNCLCKIKYKDAIEYVINNLNNQCDNKININEEKLYYEILIQKGFLYLSHTFLFAFFATKQKITT